MVDITVNYQGRLHCEATHGPSATTLTTDAPRDNHGLGESFSPTDLVATALGTCILTVMGIAANKLNVDITGAAAHVTKEMAAKPPRKIASLKTVVTMPKNPEKSARVALEAAALHCPVHQSLHHDIDAPITFHWPD